MSRVRISLVAALALLAGCAEPAAPRPNVVLIVIDTLRVDSAPPLADLETAPFLASLARESLVFDGAMSTSSWTAPATASLFTSLHPEQHGLHTGLRVTRDRIEGGHLRLLSCLPEEVETLPETMRRLGYRTAAVVDNPTVCEVMGFARGFDHFVHHDYAGAETVNEAALSLRGALRGAEPSFLYLHYMDPHRPYHMRPTFDPEQFTGALWDELVAVLGHEPQEFGEEEVLAFAELMETHPDRETANAESRELARLAYDSEVVWLDGLLRKLFEELPIDDETLVILTADHGEEFGERGHVGHGFQVYDELVRVPLLVRLPRAHRRTGRVAGAFSLIDIAPTLRSYLGDPQAFTGEGLDLLAGPVASERTLFAHRVNETEGARAEKVAVRRDRWKAILRFPDGNGELYDVHADPAESRDLAQEHPEVLAELREAWATHSATLRSYERSFSEAQPLTADEIETLERLGYVDED